MAEAEAARGSGDYDRAIQIYRHITRIEPTSATALSKEAEIHWMLNRAQIARQCLSEALKRDESKSSANALLARIELGNEEYQSAEKHLETAVRSEPSNVAARMLLAEVYARGGKQPKAVEQFEQVLNVDPANVVARLNVVAHQATSGKIEQAIKTCRAGLNKNRHPRLQLELGELYMQVGKLAEAVDYFKAARDAESHDSEAFQMLAIACGARNDWPSALDYAQIFTEFGADNLNATVLTAWSAYASGDILEAKNRLEQAVELQPQGAELRNLLAIMLIDLRRFPQALEQLNEAQKLAPEDVRVQMNLAMLDLVSDKFADGLKRASSIASDHPDLAAAVSLAAYANLLNGKTDTAKTLATQALSNDNNESLAHVTLARILRADGEYDEALTHLNHVTGTVGGGAFLQEELAQVLLAKGDYAKSAEAAQFALQLSSSNQEAKRVLARALAKQNNWDGALLYLRELSARNPKDLAAKLELAEALVQKGDYDSAERAYQGALKIAPKSPLPIEELAKLAELQGNKRLAKRFRTQLKSMGPSARN